jgi:very-short-patch-repair endonuclease
VGMREARSCTASEFWVPLTPGYNGVMKGRRVSRRLTARARDLRADATKQEHVLWRLLSRYRPKFTRQLSIEPYIADFACRQAKLVVEIDGSQHIASRRDEVRTRFLEEEGWTVIRFWNSDVNANPVGVAQAILQRAAECLGGTHPQPLPSREGRSRRRSERWFKNPLRRLSMR